MPLRLVDHKKNLDKNPRLETVVGFFFNERSLLQREVRNYEQINASHRNEVSDEDIG